MASRTRTTPEERRAIVESERSLNPPHRGGRSPFGEVVRLELIARGLFPADRPIAGDELPPGEAD